MNKKSKFFIFLMLFSVLFMITSVSAGSNETEMIGGDATYHSFDDLNRDIANATGDTLDLKYDYENINTTEVFIKKDDAFTINGNNHKIRCLGIESTLNFSSNDTVTINDLIFENCSNIMLFVENPLVFNNVKFINCSGSSQCFLYTEKDLSFKNCTFQLNGYSGEFIDVSGPLNITDCSFTGNNSPSKGLIHVIHKTAYIENSTFMNFNVKGFSALNIKAHALTIKKSKFINMHTDISGGAVMIKFFKHNLTSFNPFLIEDCIFSNVSSLQDGGAVYMDLDSGVTDYVQTCNMRNITFDNCSSRFGGALLNIGGILNIADSSFINSYASYYGGALYATWSNATLINTSIVNNTALRNAGGVYFDKGKLTIINSNLTNNKVINEANATANCIYAFEVDADFENSIFANGGVGVYAVFAGDSKLVNITKEDDVFLMDNENYIVSVETEGIKLNLINNDIEFETLPSNYSSADMGWVSPIKIQGDSLDCWAFATVATLESALLKSTGVYYNLSANYVQKYQIKYHTVFGDLRNSQIGFSYSGLGYALSWYGTLLSDGIYDDRGLISDCDMNVSRIHLQDAMIIFSTQNYTDLMKKAIMKYGSVTVMNPQYNETNESSPVVDTPHFFSIFGWDDSLDVPDEENESIIHKGSWICKDSMLHEYSFVPFSVFHITIDGNPIVPQDAVIAYIFENDIDYHVNYQTDLIGLCGFDSQYTYYSNEFTSKYSELIGAVGTYFNDSGVSYSFDVYLNGIKVHSQSGISEFAGFKTIKLNKYIAVKAGDKFKVVFKNNCLPYQAYAKQHYVSGMSMVSADGKSFSDLTLQNKTVCLKVYTVKDDSKIINNKNIAVDYTGGSYFTVNAVTSTGISVVSAVVKFTINGKTTTVKTDSNGVAKIKITQLPKKYTLTTSYNGKTYKNTVKVKQVLKTSKVKVKKTVKKFYLKAKLKINGKLVKGKVIKFKFKGKTYKAKTNKKGIAKKAIKKKVIKKLKKGKKYKFKVIYKKTSIKSKVKVK